MKLRYQVLFLGFVGVLMAALVGALAFLVPHAWRVRWTTPRLWEQRCKRASTRT